MDHGSRERLDGLRTAPDDSSHAREVPILTHYWTAWTAWTAFRPSILNWCICCALQRSRHRTATSHHHSPRLTGFARHVCYVCHSLYFSQAVRAVQKSVLTGISGARVSRPQPSAAVQPVPNEKMPIVMLSRRLDYSGSVGASLSREG